MDRGRCNVIYVDQRLLHDRRLDNRSSDKSSDSPPPSTNSSQEIEVPGENADASCNVRTILSVFSNVHACAAASACIDQVSSIPETKAAGLTPTLVLVDTSSDEAIEDSSGSSPSSERRGSGIINDCNEGSLFGIRLLKWLGNEIRCQNISKLVVPIAVVPGSLQDGASSGLGVLSALGISSVIAAGSSSTPQVQPLSPGRMLKYLDAGAVDVARSPFSEEPLSRLAVHAYRAHKEVVKEHEAFLSVKRVRKRSWVGVNEEKPFAYLRESMVSGLMDGICKPENVGQSFDNTKINVDSERRTVVAEGIGSWSFSAHDYSDDELVLCASLMLQHALEMPELEQWRIPADQVEKFLVATRAAYNNFVPYHNFRHVVDVLQAIFYFLVQLGLLNDYPANHSPHPPKPSAPIAKLLSPFEALTLLITAIGHDVGHPGVNNLFLVVLKAPLAQLYNDQSVLESFHCAAYSQLLRRHWPAVFHDAGMRKLMIDSILATDMGLHFDYMKKLGLLQEKLHANDGGTLGWDGRAVAENKTLACSLLIKCADISNVARKYDVAIKWANILTAEFARQANMEKDVGIPSTLFAPPIEDNIIALGESQVNFMNFFALPLFQGVRDILPPMQFSVDELNTNKARWQKRIEEEKERGGQRGRDPEQKDGVLSPRSGSAASDAKAQESESPEEIAVSSNDKPDSSVSPSAKYVEPSRPTSIGTFGPQANGQRRSLDQSRRSSLGSPLSFASPEMASRRSSGASPAGFSSPTKLEARRSSNAVPSQLQLGLHNNQLPRSTVGQTDRSGEQNELDRPLTAGADRSARQPTSSVSKSHKHSFSERYQMVAPSGSNSLTSNGTIYPYSPLSGQTSVMSSSEKIASILPKAPYPSDHSESQLYGSEPGDTEERPNTSSDSIPTMRRRTSRFRLNFWKSKRRTQATNSSV